MWISTITAFAFFAVSVHSQTPAFQGALLLEPGLSSTKCLTAASDTDGAIVTIESCNGGPNQKWTFAGGSIKIFSNRCLDATAGNTTDGSKVQIWTCYDNTPNQLWSYDKWNNQLTWLNKGKCLDLPSGSLADGNRIQLWGCNNGDNINQVWKSGYLVNSLPQTSQEGQYGVNNCGTNSTQTANCQTAWINSASDFCIWAPPYTAPVGDTESVAIAYCTKSGRGSRLIPDGTLQGVHFVKTPEYVQITGVGDFTKVNIPSGDSGGEIDNRGADGRGNPIGGLVYGDAFGAGLQYHEWTSFISDKEFCFRACIGARATSLCNHVYDIMGCYWNIPANYNPGQFEDCEGAPATPMGVYGTSTWSQGVNPTPSAHPAPASSNCKALPTVSVTPALRRRGQVHVKHIPFPGATPAP